MPTYSEKAAARIAHIQKHLDVRFTSDKIASYVYNIEHQQGNPKGAAMLLSSHAEAQAMYAWFARSDLDAMRQWCFVTSKLDQLWIQAENSTAGPIGTMWRLMHPLLANHEDMIAWFASYDAAYDAQEIEEPGSMGFFAYQAILAVRGEWERLAKRCDLVLAREVQGKYVKKYVVDHRFYLALANGDRNGMREALASLLSPRTVRGRDNDESGFTCDLISTAAVVCAKIAWRHGYEVIVDSPYLPPEWLSPEPLTTYALPYAFMR